MISICNFVLIGMLSFLLVSCAAPRLDCQNQLPQDQSHANAGCLIVAYDKVLLVRHRVTGKLGIPAGTAEDQERAACTARRETWEEVGLEVDVVRHLNTFSNGFRLYRCKVIGESIKNTRHQPYTGFHRAEISEILLLPENEISAQQWRFPEYYFDFLRVVNAEVSGVGN